MRCSGPGTTFQQDSERHEVEDEIILEIRVIPNAHRDAVETRPDGTNVVRVMARATEGRANDAVRRVVAKHFGARVADVDVLRGQRARRKTLVVRRR